MTDVCTPLHSSPRLAQAYHPRLVHTQSPFQEALEWRRWSRTLLALRGTPSCNISQIDFGPHECAPLRLPNCTYLTTSPLSACTLSPRTCSDIYKFPGCRTACYHFPNCHHAFPTAPHPALSRPLQLSFPEYFISSSLAAQKPVSQNYTRDLPMPRRPPTSRGGDSYYIDITLGGQNFSAMIDMGMYTLYICLTSSVLA